MKLLPPLLVAIVVVLVIAGGFWYSSVYHQPTPADVVIKASKVNLSKAYDAYKSMDSRTTITFKIDKKGLSSEVKEFLDVVGTFLNTVPLEDVPDTIAITADFQSVGPFVASIGNFSKIPANIGTLSVSSNMVNGNIHMEMRFVDDQFFVRFFDFFSFTDTEMQKLVDEYTDVWLSVGEDILPGATNPAAGADPKDSPHLSSKLAQDLTFTPKEERKVQHTGVALARILLDAGALVPSFAEEPTDDEYRVAYRIDMQRLQEALNDERLETKVIRPFAAIINDVALRAVPEAAEQGTGGIKGEERMVADLLRLRDGIVEFIRENGEDVTLSGILHADAKTFAIANSSLDLNVASTVSTPPEEYAMEIDAEALFTLSEQEVMIQQPTQHKPLSGLFNAILLRIFAASFAPAAGSIAPF